MAQQETLQKIKKDPLMRLRHTTEHVLQAAMKKIYPDIKYVMGPPIENGFYFDFDLDKSINKEDFKTIEKEMKKIIGENLKVEMKEVTMEEARELFKGNNYKQDTLNEIEDRNEKITICVMGEEDNPTDVDLCMGGHTKKTGDIKAFKLLSVAGAYYKGDENNKMLQRVYGTAFKSQKELDEYLNKLEEAKERDHRKLGKELDLYVFTQEVGPGLPMYTPNGGVIIHEIEEFMRTMQTKMGYGHVYTPHLAKSDLYEKSGHLEWFKDGMYPPMVFEGEGEYYCKPMNCPFHIQIFNNRPKSYRELPVRYAEFGTVYRYEKSGEISGIIRSRGFTQDDAHIFCREDQVVDEFIGIFNFTDTLLNGLGLIDRRYRLSLKGEGRDKYAGNNDQWDKATDLIRQALNNAGIEYEEAPGEAAFYGPKLDILFKDAVDREWQISTIQVDFLLPERFNIEYINEEGEKERPYMLHRAPLGSRERILALLIEQYKGAFPVWLSPIQIEILPITDKQIDYAQKIKDTFMKKGLRVEINDKDSTIGAKIRDAQLSKVPYMFILGEKEEKAEEISVRLRTGEQHNGLKIEEVLDKINNMYLTRSLKLW